MQSTGVFAFTMQLPKFMPKTRCFLLKLGVSKVVEAMEVLNVHELFYAIGTRHLRTKVSP